MERSSKLLQSELYRHDDRGQPRRREDPDGHGRLQQTTQLDKQLSKLFLIIYQKMSGVIIISIFITNITLKL